MNLAWIAAVLAPNEVATRPTAFDEAQDGQEPARLADLVLGRLRVDAPGGPLLRAARRTLFNDTIREAVPELAVLVHESAQTDPARAAAYGLVLCSAAAELDDYATCFDTLDLLLEAVRGDSADEALVRAALLQQSAIRHRDANRPHLRYSESAASALGRVQPESCTPFPTGGDDIRPEDVIVTMIDNLRAAISSLVTQREADQEGLHDVLEWRLTAQRRGSELTRRANLERANRYADYVKATFKEEFDRRRRIFGTGSYSDLFVSALFLELAGHGNAYAARRELALLRLMQLNQNAADAADTLRLLRHATAKDELAFVLRTFIDAGPLSGLATDARQILHKRSDPDLLRIVELQVLEAAADLMTSEEARQGLDAVRAVLDAGGPPDLPGKWQLRVLRRSVAWSAAAALSNVCGATNEIAGLLLAEARNSPLEEGQIFDAELGRAVSLMDWDQVGAAERELWRVERTRLSDRLPGTMSLVSARAALPAEPAKSASWLERLAVDLNNMMHQHRQATPLLNREVVSLREELLRIRADAAAGQFSTGGLSVADIAAAAAIVAETTDLWPDLTEFLLDVRVSREDRSQAFDRLARAEITLPNEVVSSFAQGIRHAIITRSVDVYTAESVPYPAALRFGAAHGLLEEIEVADYAARLLGSADAVSRIEGVRTVALFANKGIFESLATLVLPSIEDENVDVRAMTAVALVQYARRDGPMRSLFLTRIIDLLDSDGILLPRATLDAIAEAPDLLHPGYPLYQRLASLMDHPAFSIRRRAGKLLT
ncbi:hypothetical protein NIE79_004735 [Micromonospora sp. NIE79]|uniref:HEAT repeat domain-containing protein n=1 Tax=Micromonospora trifolii TaxID=2911208 RepID=A0ABS9N878_9ACTN|nr:hypothetical protein [Micromonospora trifolii]MCG5446167.1 hypothetical protein [Micromonospora trifolii]